MKNPSLSQLQSDFSQALRAASPSLDTLGLAGPASHTFERFEVYRYMFQERLCRCVSEDFPEVEAIVGEEEFGKLIRDFVATQKSSSWNIAEYSRQFPPFVATHPRLSEFPFLADLANLEWQKNLCWFREVPNPMAADALVGKTDKQWATAILVLNPSLTFLEVDYFVEDVATLGSATWTPAKVMIYRGRTDLIVRRALAIDDQIIQGIQKGMGMLSLSEWLLDCGRTSTDMEKWFAEAVRSELISDVIF